MFIDNDEMQFNTIYHNLDNDNVFARFAHLHCKLQFSCLILVKSTTIQLHSCKGHQQISFVNEKMKNHAFALGLLMDE
jgi:hypothetical protein